MNLPDDLFQTRRVEIVNLRGLHARAAAKFAKLAGSYNAEITVLKDGMAVPGSSIMGLMMLAAAKGSALELQARGPASSAALVALAALVANRFDEDE